MRLVTLLSDYGSTSPYPAEMKAVLSAQTGALIIDITHGVPPHDVRTGAYLLRAVARHTPVGTPSTLRWWTLGWAPGAGR